MTTPMPSVDDHVTDSNNQPASSSSSPGIDLFPAAVRAIEDDDLEKMELLMGLESFNKEKLDNLVSKACKRSKDISMEEKFVKEAANFSDSEEEQSMLSICQTARKNNEKLKALLMEAGSHAKLVEKSQQLAPQSSNQKSLHNESFHTPPEPVIKSQEKGHRFMRTPEMPKLKSRVHRELKF